MDPSVPRIPSEELLAHSAWVERLVRSFVRDPDLAGDVRQEVWLAALERPPRERAERSLAAWLRSITRTMARQAYRSERRRSVHEQAAAAEVRAERRLAQSTDEVVLRGELHALVMNAVLALEEPYRSCVLLRYLDGFDSFEIAERLGLEPTAVRKRLSRANAILRGRLQRKLEDRGGLACLLILLRLPRAEATVGAPLIASHGAMLFVAVSALALCAIAITAWRQDESGADVVSNALAATDSPPTDILSSNSTLANELPLAGSRRLATTAPASRPDAAAATLRVSARILGADDRALVGALLGLAGDPTFDARVDADGRVELVLKGPLPFDALEENGAGRNLMFSARAPGHAQRRIALLDANYENDYPILGCRTVVFPTAPGQTLAVDLGDLRLVAADTLVGQVLDEHGRGVAGAVVCGASATHDPVTAERNAELNAEYRRLFGPAPQRMLGMVWTDARGHFEIPRPETEDWCLAAGHAGYTWSRSPLLPAAGQALELRLAPLPAENAVSGIVLDGHGEPLAGAMLLVADALDPGTTASFLFAAKSGRDGRFVFPVGADRLIDVRAFEWSERFAASTARNIRAGDTGVVLQLLPGRKVTVNATDTDGTPVTALSVGVRRAGEPDCRWFHAPQAGPLQFLVPDVPFTLETDTDGLLEQTLGPFQPHSVPARLDLVFQHPPRLRGQATAAGEPLAGVRVQLYRLHPQNEDLAGLPSRLMLTGVQGATTDAAGRFDLPLLFDEPLVLYALRRGWAPTELGPLALSPRRDHELEVQLTPGGSIAGRVVQADGQAAANLSVNFRRSEVRSFRTTTDANGNFEIHELTPGRWRVNTPGQQSQDCMVLEGETTHLDLELWQTK